MNGFVTRRGFVVAGAVCVCSVLLPCRVVAGASVAAVQPPTLVSVSRGGGAANGVSSAPSISSDGRYVAFVSKATNAVKHDTNHASDVFVRDLVAQKTSLVSVAIGGGAANGASDEPAISGDGRYVAFRSSAKNLVSGDTNGVADIFVRDLVAKTTTRVSITTGGKQADAESADPFITVDGSLVAFTSTAGNLGAPTGTYSEAFTHNLRNGATLLAGVGAGEADCGDTNFYRTVESLSGDGKHIAISAFCPGTFYLYDRVRRTGATQLVAAVNTGSGSGGNASSIRYTANGSTMAWVYTDARGDEAVEFFDTATGVRDSVDPLATDVYGGGLGFSADGRRIVYIGGNGHGDNHIFAGSTIGQPKIYSYDRSDGALRYVSVPLGGAAAEASKSCGDPVLSADGTTAAFVCAAGDLVAGDNNGVRDVFARPVASAPPPDLQAVVSTPDVSVTEPTTGSTNATITVNLDRPVELDSEIQIEFHDITATSPADYDGSTQYIDFAPGQASGTVEVPVYADNLLEGDETFAVTTSVEFGAVTLGPHANAIVTIHDPTP